MDTHVYLGHATIDPCLPGSKSSSPNGTTIPVSDCVAGVESIWMWPNLARPSRRRMDSTSTADRAKLSALSDTVSPIHSTTPRQEQGLVRGERGTPPSRQTHHAAKGASFGWRYSPTTGTTAYAAGSASSTSYPSITSMAGATGSEKKLDLASSGMRGSRRAATPEGCRYSATTAISPRVSRGSVPIKGGE